MAQKSNYTANGTRRWKRLRSVAVGRNDLGYKCRLMAMHSERVPLLIIGRLFQSRLRVYAQKSVGAPAAYPRLLSDDAFSVLVPPAILFHKTFWAFIGCRDAACRVLDLAFPLQNVARRVPTYINAS